MEEFTLFKHAHYCQADNTVLRRPFNEAARDGMCHAASIAWCGLIASNPNTSSGNAAKRIGLLGRNHGGANPILQHVFNQRYRMDMIEGLPASISHADDLILTIAGLSREMQDGIAYNWYSEDDLFSHLYSSSAPFLLYLMGGNFYGAFNSHTIAFYLPGRQGVGQGFSADIACFDPNNGEYWIPEGEIRYWWSAFLDASNMIPESHWGISLNSNRGKTFRGR
jgi:hypothetical protein